LSLAVVVIVGAGLCAVILAAAAGGVDAMAGILIVLIVALGALAVSVARKARSGTVEPRTCAKCGGLVSPRAPFCKHCGEPLDF
jgi:hypothetical protein